MKSICYLLGLLVLMACGNDNTSSPSSSAAASGASAQTVNYQSTVSKTDFAKITANLQGLAGEAEAYLVGMFTGNQYVMDTAQVSGTSIVFENEEPYQGGFGFIWLPNSRKSIQLLLGNDQEFTLNGQFADHINTMQVEGSIDNELLYKNLKFQQEQQALVNAVNNKMKAVADKESEAYKTLKAESDALADQRMAHLNEIFTEHPGTFFTTFKRSGQNPITRDIRQADGSVDGRAQVYYYRNEFWDNVNFDDERLLYTPVISNKLDRYMKKLTDQNADSLKVSADKLLGRVLDKPEYYKYIANWIAVNYEPGKVEIMDAEAVYVHMVQNYFTYDRAFWSDSAQVYALQLRANEMSQSLVGQKAPLITSTNQFGQSVSMADIQSKYIAVFMYNPTCDHCIEQTPQLVELYKKLKPRGLEVFAIALDTEDAVWKDFIKKYKMDFINVWDPTNRSIYGKYYVDNTPEVYLLDEDRVLFAKNIKVNQIEEAIRLHEEK